MTNDEQVTGTAEYGSAPRTPAQQPGRRVESRFGQRAMVLRHWDAMVALSVHGEGTITITRREFEEDWWPARHPRDTERYPRGSVRVTPAVQQAAYEAYCFGGDSVEARVHAAVKAAFEAVGLQVIE
jgi:hypothetical protein